MDCCDVTPILSMTGQFWPSSLHLVHNPFITNTNSLHHHQCVSTDKFFDAHIILIIFLSHLGVSSCTWIQHQICGQLHPSDHHVVQETSQQENTLHGLWKHREPLSLPFFFFTFLLANSLSLSLQEQLSFPSCKPFLWWELYHVDLLWHLYTLNIWWH